MKYNILGIFFILLSSCTPDLEDNKRLYISGNISNYEQHISEDFIELFLTNAEPRTIDPNLTVDFSNEIQIGEKILGRSRVKKDGSFNFFSIAQEGGFYQLSFLRNSKLVQTGTVSRDYLIDLEENFNNIQLQQTARVQLNFQNNSNPAQEINYFVEYSSPRCNLNYNGTEFSGNAMTGFCIVQGGRIEINNIPQADALITTFPSVLKISFTNALGNQELVYAINAPNQVINVPF